MKRLILGIILALGVSFNAYAQGTKLCYTSNGVNCIAGVQAAKSVAIDISTATTTELVALDTTKAIYVTSWNVIVNGTGTFKLVYGSGTACGTGTTALTGAYPLTTQTGLAPGDGLGPIILVPLGKALCATTSANIQHSGSVSYAQF